MQCQKKSWYYIQSLVEYIHVTDRYYRPYHRQDCSTEDGKGMTYFTQKIFNNPLIRHYLELALIYEFNLHNAAPDERMELSRAPLHAYIDLLIEPRDLEQRSALFAERDAWIHEGVEAVVLINTVFDVSERSSPPEFTEAALHTVRHALPDSYIVVLNIRHSSNRISTNVLGLRPQMIQIARENNFGFKRITSPLHAIRGPSVPLQGFYNPKYSDGPGTPDMDDDVCNVIK